MGKCRTWLARVCCCCCCCCLENKETKPLLNATSADSSKEPTPSRELQGISEVRVRSDDEGVEVQEMEVSVKEEVKGQDTPVVLREKKTAPTGEGPSERARVDSGTFVRSSGSRSSWRMIPTVTQQAREQAAAKERAEKEEKRKSAILTSSSNLGDGEIVFSDEAIDEEPSERVVTLVAQEEGEDSTAKQESRSMTIAVTSTSTLVRSEEADREEETAKKEVDEGFVNDTS